MDERTIAGLLKDRAKETPDRIGMTDLDVAYTWKQIDAITDKKAKQLNSQGIQKGSHVGIWAENSAEWVFLFLALQKIGAITVLFNVAYKWRELEKNLERCDVEYLFYSASAKDTNHMESITHLNREALPKLKEMFLLPEEPERAEEILGEDAVSEWVAPMQADDVCSILFTSGTTGIAKGVMLTHRNLVNNSKELVDCMEWVLEDEMCLAVPLFHCFGITVGILGALHTGMAMNIVRRFSTGAVFSCIEKWNCTLFNGVPTMFLAMLNSKKRQNYCLDSLRGGLVAGSTIAPTDYKKVCEEFKLSNLHMAFGQTECSPAVSATVVGDGLEEKAASVGRPLKHVEVSIWKDGKPVPAGMEGEIMTRGYHVMKGYYRLPEETSKAVSAEGWLATGDLGFLDEAGYLHISGRIKELIIRGGENISPLEIQNVLCQMEGVAQVAVVGVPAPVIQEEVVACIIWNEGMEKTKEEVTQFVSGQLAEYKVPRFVLPFDSFPLNASGKIITKELSRLCVERLGNSIK